MERNLAALYDMANAAREAVLLVSTLNHNQFLADRRTQLAILHLIALIGEAARRTTAEFRMQHAEIPWPQAMGMRNKVVHEYDDVDLELIWDVLVDDLPALISQIEPICEEE